MEAKMKKWRPKYANWNVLMDTEPTRPPTANRQLQHAQKEPRHVGIHNISAYQSTSFDTLPMQHLQHPYCSSTLHVPSTPLKYTQTAHKMSQKRRNPTVTACFPPSRGRQGGRQTVDSKPFWSTKSRQAWSTENF